MPAFAVLLWGFMIPQQSHPVPTSGLIFTGVWTLLALSQPLYAFRLRKVRLDGDQFVISIYGTEVRVPLKQVATVSGGTGGNGRIRITFRNTTDFSKAIEFLPPLANDGPWEGHPLVAELKQLCGLPSD